MGLNIVDLGLVYEIKTDNDNIFVKMTLTSPMCPVGPMIMSDAEENLKKIPGAKEVKLELTFVPPWGPDKMTEEAKLQLGVEQIFLFMSYDSLYSASIDNILWPEKPGRLILKIKDYLSNGKILDAGCGDGKNSTYLEKQGFSVTGFDISSKALNHCHS